MKWIILLRNKAESEYIEIELLSRGAANYVYDCNLLISMQTSSTKITQEVWVDGYEFKCFLNNLDKLQSVLIGEASITSETIGELLISIRSVDTSGHFVFHIELGKQKLIGPELFWTKTVDVFPIETTLLDEICADFEGGFREIKNA
ncbi:hypothetical protein BC355_19410 [Vibrio cholerae]|uniref:Uncharacterized protein n=1 Tax=Vibrio cholerae TaxID=666 RepID=A0A395TYJ7_VIBCL|nr:hypothetical protein [Vibrio cholerae]RGP89458.1 hypothetical protein BC355_19410 [Vibrio cholerae]RGP89652.1 hypothetical protein BC353_19335 [Vibrio cholerae]